MKKVLLFLISILLLTGCGVDGKIGGQEMYQGQFFDTFDTVTTVSVAASSEEEARKYMEMAHDRYMELHKLYDKYHTYEGMANIKTINDEGAKAPVKVDKDLLDLLVLSKERNKTLSDEVNIAMGAVLNIWSDYRKGHEAGVDFEGHSDVEHDDAKLPPREELEAAAKHCNIDDLIIDEENSTVFLKDPEMKLDVGAVAKGYATELVAKELEEAGVEHAILSAGGNVRLIGDPIDPGKERFVIGLQNPQVLTDDGTGSNVIDAVYVNDMSVVSSGDYQRYYVVDGKAYHHIIDKDTLFPGEHFRGVSVVTKDSGLGDFLSTAIFLMPLEEGMELINSLEDTEAYWILPDMSVRYTKGLAPMLRSAGASN